MNIKTSTKESGFTLELDSIFQDEYVLLNILDLKILKENNGEIIIQNFNKNE